jgi:hypothetical protein
MTNSRCYLTATAAVVLLLLASCSTNTMPTAEDMDRYYAKAEEMAEGKIAVLAEKRDRGELTPEQFVAQSTTIRGHIADQATDMAWARHENIEAQKRALGVPTGDHPVKIQVPGAGAGESFYRRAGEVAGSSQYNSAPYGGSVTGGPNRGDRPSLPPVQPPGGQPDPNAPAEEAGADPSAPVPAPQ